jgi:opacity protein-like surface antigen
MKKHLLTIGAAALAVFATQQAAQATLTSVESGTASFAAEYSGTPQSVSVEYDVMFDSTSSLFTYLYSYAAPNGHPIQNFTINADYVNSVLPSLFSISGDPMGSSGITLTATTQGGSESFGAVTFGTASAYPSVQLVGYTSLFGPTAGTGSINDGSKPSPWSDNGGGSPIPVPVPEASTVMAGALMLLPFGIGAVRSLRKERV